MVLNMLIEEMLNPNYELESRFDSLVDLLSKMVEQQFETEEIEMLKAS